MKTCFSVGKLMKQFGTPPALSKRTPPPSTNHPISEQFFHDTPLKPPLKTRNPPNFRGEETMLIDLSFNSNCVCVCLENNKLKNMSGDLLHKIINIKELNFEKTQIYSNADHNEHVVDPTSFNYYLTHDFHKLINKNSNKANKVNFSVLYTNMSPAR